jgi:hypothetical protein
MIPISSLESYNALIEKISRKNAYSVDIRGIRKIIYIGKKKIALFRPGIPIPDLQSKEARRLMAQVRASVTRYIKKTNFQVPAIKKEYPVTFTNRFFWESIPENTEFFIIDAKHAYWRIAYLHGYINKKLYEKYAENKEMKQVKNISLSILNSRQKRQYYSGNKLTHEIGCDTSLYCRVYDNIRYFSYNLCGSLRNSLDESCFAYRTDGVFILKPGLHDAKKIFEKNNLLYKIEKCVKVDNKTFSTQDGELKNFI